MKSISLLIALLLSFSACTPMGDKPAPEDQKKEERQNESFGTDRPE